MSQDKPIPVSDPLHVREVFANEVLAYGQMDGVVHLTLGVQRFDGIRSSGELQQSREVVCRLALSESAFEALHDGLTRIKIALEDRSAARAQEDGPIKTH
jgi:hypothetical protein